MTYSEYKERIETTETKSRLEEILEEIENDFENISDRKYENLRYLVLKKIYA